METTAADTVEITAADTVEITAANTVETTATDTVEITAADTVETTAANTVETTAADTVEITAANTVETTAADTVETTTTDTHSTVETTILRSADAHTMEGISSADDRAQARKVVNLEPVVPYSAKTTTVYRLDPRPVGYVTAPNPHGDTATAQGRVEVDLAVGAIIVGSDNSNHTAKAKHAEGCAAGQGQSPVGCDTSVLPQSEDNLVTTVAQVVSTQSGRQHQVPTDSGNIGDDQQRDSEVMEIKQYLSSGALPQDQKRAWKLALQASQFSLIDGVVYRTDPKTRHKCAVVPGHLREELLRVTHAGKYSGHFSGRRLFDTLAMSWWWETMRADAESFVRSCPECVVATGTGRRYKPPLHPIPVEHPFQVLGIDIMDLPLTEKGNKHVVVIQDLFTKWPLVFPVPDQKATRIARLIAEEVVRLFGVPESLLSDRGTNLLSHLVLDLCHMLGVTKLNTTAHHPQCDGAVERFNRTLKTMLRKHAARFGNQWDTYLSGVLWAYKNTPHASTREKPSFLLFGIDCRSPTEAAYMPTGDLWPAQVDDYREQLMMTLSSARELAASNIRKAQGRYKEQYDRHARPCDLRLGQWVFVKFPQDESGRLRKLSRPWHGPYRLKNPDVTVVKVYHPQHGEMRVHQMRLCLCPDNFPAGYYWYGGKQKGPGRPPKWVEKFLNSGQTIQHPVPDAMSRGSRESIRMRGSVRERESVRGWFE